VQPAVAAATAPLAASPTPESTTEPAPAPAAATEPAPQPPAAVATPAPQGEPARSPIWPWLLGALVVIGAAAFLLRRRRSNEIYDSDNAEEAFIAPPVMGTQIADTSYVAAVPVAAAEIEAAASPAVPAPLETGRPAIALQMRPVRAGVNEDDAVVEFELTVDNQGDAAAHHLRISTWMFAAGHASDAERELIQPAEGHDLPEVTILSGHAKRIESAVALPTSGFAEDSVLPVVVAEAHYRLADGTEEHTTAAFEVGVPMGEELAHFSLDNPSGMHDDVVARPHREIAEA
jgi:hypothetical protein